MIPFEMVEPRSLKEALSLLDPEEPGLGTAAGSACFLAEGQIFPIARASVLREIPQMLFDPLGPLVVRPRYALRFLPWGLRFLRGIAPERVRAATRALAALNRGSVAAHADFASRIGATPLLVHNGEVVACRKDSELASWEPDVREICAQGIRAEIVSRERLLELEPALADAFAGGIFFPGVAHYRDVPAFGRRIVEAIVSGGNRSMSSEDGGRGNLLDRAATINSPAR